MPFRITVPLVFVVAFASVGVGGLFLSDGVRSKGKPDVIKIVSSLPRSGSARGQTDSIVQGIKLALHEVNHQITLTDGVTYKLEYLDLDDATAAAGNWTIEQEIANANQAKADPDVMAYIGTYNSGAAKVSMPILNKAGVLMISPANTATSLTKPGWGGRHEPQCYRPTGRINYTRVVPADDVQGAVAAQWAFELQAKQVYILDDNELYGKGIADLFHMTCEERFGIKVLGQESIDSKQQEFKPLLQKIKDLKPDMIYFGGTTQTKAGQVFKDMIAVGLRCPMMGPDGCYETAMIESAGKAAFETAPFYATFGGLPISELQTGRGPQFVKNFTDYFGKPPTEAYAAYGYECGLVALDAIRRAGRKDRDAVREAGLATRDFVGTIGTWSFDANGDTDSKTMSVNVVKDGEFKFVKKLELKK
ncbi:MAG: branched-chain amino acid ABC transporter substrate-binding protein [Fimbriiglobus sp.]|jgi:branched-chain amino acid transport system substrate-binding protein|nr:branched-chain amino acid ABC transporter substrate-binding protein [Fimbriiglobus sp.]